MMLPVLQQRGLSIEIGLAQFNGTCDFFLFRYFCELYIVGEFRFLTELAAVEWVLLLVLQNCSSLGMWFLQPKHACFSKSKLSPTESVTCARLTAAELTLETFLKSVQALETHWSLRISECWIRDRRDVNQGGVSLLIHCLPC
jgi:hypothetical protein